MIKKILLFLSCFVFLFVSCWKHQDNDITKPAIPTYNLSGYIRDIDSKITLGSCVLQLESVALIYDAQFSMVDTTDANGYYQFDKVIPGQYEITVYRETYDAITVNLNILHSDKQFDILTPKVYLSNECHDYDHSAQFGTLTAPKFEGIQWIDRTTLAGVWTWKEHADDRTRYRIIIGNFESGFTILGTQSFVPENSEMNGLTYLHSYFSFFDQKLLTIEPGSGKIKNEQDSRYTLTDLTTDKTDIWALTNAGKIVQFNRNGSQLLNTYSVSYEKPGGIAWFDGHIWAFDKYDNLLQKFDAELSVMETYCPIFIDENSYAHHINGIQYMSFDVDGNLWMNKGYSIYVLPGH
ncbi:hypothetical protein JW960_18835 [candidate division KSB1 bacterium]|nr:hypothetical protein [candidate division KSB1 bacterium]